MKLVLKIKLLPNIEQKELLIKTIKEANTVCNAISNVAWQEKIFNQSKIHNRVYHSLKSSFNLSAQMLVRAISKVADSYKKDKKPKEYLSLSAV